MDAQRSLPSHFFRRVDESDDRLFYSEPRLVVHIDDNAIAAIGQYLDSALPGKGLVLDLMSSWRSHLPRSFDRERVVGLGLNEVEMRENPQLGEYAVHDLNKEPRLPFDDGAFDAALVTVSIQYMTRPVEVFREVRRTLSAGARFHVLYSNRMFPTKAVEAWQALDNRRRGQLVEAYFALSGGWEDVSTDDISPRSSGYTDPVYVVSARNAGGI